MASSKAKRIRERLEQIRSSASEMNAASVSTAPFVKGSDLAEEAAQLGLELADLLEAKAK
jgi:hypothetical protein